MKETLSLWGSRKLYRARRAGYCPAGMFISQAVKEYSIRVHRRLSAFIL
ncbi:MAG TPA: hypothetical protein PKW53_11980 [Syntrophorhabdus sp.]|nr:hypothetical protein [Syntrophorhabdus sp.]